MVLLPIPWGIPYWKKPYETARKYTIALLRPYHKEVSAERHMYTRPVSSGAQGVSYGAWGVLYGAYWVLARRLCE